MKKQFAILAASATLMAPQVFASSVEKQKVEEKEWTILTFLNGNNNLDHFGFKDMNEMEVVGSNDRINVVAQWASMGRESVQRVYVQKDEDTENVTSPVVQDMGSVDMGSWENLVDFIRWGVENYPAKHYFVNVWNHGSGWHMTKLNSLKNLKNKKGFASINDISWDDKTGNYITTEQLGLAMKEASKMIGRRVDIYGSDACLMAMAEVAGEMSDTVSVFVGAQELEPGDGWPYDTWLAGVMNLPEATPAAVATVLVDEYYKSYYNDETASGSEVTLSALDLTKTSVVNTALQGLVDSISKLDAAELEKVRSATASVQSFYYSDYVDLVDLVKLSSQAQTRIHSDVFAQVNAALSDYIIANKATPQYANANGVSVWYPQSNWKLNDYADRYKGLEFQKQTMWFDLLKSVGEPTL